MRLGAYFALLFAVMVPFACSKDGGGDEGSTGKRPGGGALACTPGESKPCSAACGAGFQVCADDGSKLNACQCTNRPPAGGGGTSAEGGAAGASSGTAGTSSGTAGSTAGTGGSQTSVGGTSSGRAGSSTGTGGSSASSSCDVGTPGQTNCTSCGECAKISACKTEWDTANASPAFQDFSGCVFFCFDAACGKMCDEQFPEGSALFSKFIVCQVCKACANTCVADNLDDCKKP